MIRWLLLGVGTSGGGMGSGNGFRRAPPPLGGGVCVSLPLLAQACKSRPAWMKVRSGTGLCSALQVLPSAAIRRSNHMPRATSKAQVQQPGQGIGREPVSAEGRRGSSRWFTYTMLLLRRWMRRAQSSTGVWETCNVRLGCLLCCGNGTGLGFGGKRANLELLEPQFLFF